jgi:hypothetical protein
VRGSSSMKSVTRRHLAAAQRAHCGAVFRDQRVA